MAEFKTRGAYYGVKPAALAAKTRKLVAKARAALEEVSAIWDDNFQELSHDAAMIVERIDELDPVIAEGVAFLREPLDE